MGNLVLSKIDIFQLISISYWFRTISFAIFTSRLPIFNHCWYRKWINFQFTSIFGDFSSQCRSFLAFLWDFLDEFPPFSIGFRPCGCRFSRQTWIWNESDLKFVNWIGMTLNIITVRGLDSIIAAVIDRFNANRYDCSGVACLHIDWTTFDWCHSGWLLSNQI